MGVNIEQERLLREFLIEGQESTDQLDRDLVALERNPSDQTLLAGIFRVFHSFKGSCGLLGLSRLEELTHAGESLLEQLRAGAVCYDLTAATALLATADLLRQSLRQIEAEGSDGNVDATPALEILRQAASSANDAAAGRPEEERRVIPTRASTPRNCPSPSASGNPTPVVPAEPARLPAGRNGSEAGTTGSSRRSALSRSGDSSVRVDVQHLDRLLDLVGELVLVRNRLVARSGGHQEADGEDWRQLGLITTQLQDRVMKMRLLPIGSVWSKLPRVVRDLSAECGKQVRLELTGEQTELDRAILEAIKDPLQHAIRNAIDHGIETPEVRRAAGKPAEGVLGLKAYQDGSQVVIEICDDGTGIDRDRIFRQAIDRGLIKVGAPVADAELHELIFEPGFTTAEAVTHVSGRGVGMDVVRNNVERLGGSVDIRSIPGSGTTLRLRIPLTLAIVPALVVCCHGEAFALPQSSIREVLRVPESLTDTLDIYYLRERMLPLLRLRALLACGGGDAEMSSEPRDQYLIVIEGGSTAYGLLVDDIRDTEEIVVKPLCSRLQQIPIYNGATLLGDGKVALILDTIGLERHAGLAEIRPHPDGTRLPQADPAAAGPAIETQTYLVADTEGFGRIALPARQVHRLERMATSAVEWIGSREMVRYEDGVLPLLQVEEIIGAARPAAPIEERQVVILRGPEGGVGLVVSRVFDLVETAAQPGRQREGETVWHAVLAGDVVARLLTLSDLLAVAGSAPAPAAETGREVCR